MTPSTKRQSRLMVEQSSSKSAMKAFKFFPLNADDSGRKSLEIDSEEGTWAVAGTGDGVSVDMMNDEDVDRDVNDGVDDDVDDDVD